MRICKPGCFASSSGIALTIGTSCLASGDESNQRAKESRKPHRKEANIKSIRHQNGYPKMSRYQSIDAAQMYKLFGICTSQMYKLNSQINFDSHKGGYTCHRGRKAFIWLVRYITRNLQQIFYLNLTLVYFFWEDILFF